MRISAMLLAALILTIRASAADNVPSQPTAPESVPRILTGKFAIPSPDGANAASVLGRHGCLLIHSRERFDSLLGRFEKLGWARVPKDALANVDFEKEMVVGVFDCGDVANAFSLRNVDSKPGEPAVEILMSYIIYKQRDRVVDACKFLFVAVPRAPKVKLSVATYTPQNGGPHQTPETAQLEWSGSLGDDAGDVVDGLRATLKPQANIVKAGDDIRIGFELGMAQELVVHANVFADNQQAVYVWDGKYSKGYRNHSFEVVTPDGKTHVLRPAEIREWDKNIPHPVAIKPGTPYVLPNWVEGQDLKSLHDLGLNTSQPGKYTIRGFYSEAATKADGLAMWGGEIGSNIVTVEVR